MQSQTRRILKDLVNPTPLSKGWGQYVMAIHCLLPFMQSHGCHAHLWNDSGELSTHKNKKTFSICTIL